MTEAEFLGNLSRSLDRLQHALTLADRGDALAADYLAAELRLLTLPGRGNRLLQRTEARLRDRGQAPRLELPPLSPRTGPGVSDVALVLGALPVDGESPGTWRPRSVNAWIDAPCLTLRLGESKATLEWRSVIHLAANKLGGIAHVDDQVPVTVDVLDSLVVGHLSALAFLLRAGGVLAHHVGGQLEAAMAKVAAARPSFDYHLPDGGWVSRLVVRGKIGTRDLEIGVESMQVLSIPGARTYVAWKRTPALADRVDALAAERQTPGARVEETFARVGRNEPCPCGSGRKYKQCHS